MDSKTATELQRPYLVVPKLIEQPTWGGTYIAQNKDWGEREELKNCKIGQSYELFSGSNLSLLTSSRDPQFRGELTDRDAVQIPTSLSGTVPLQHLIDLSTEGVLGVDVINKRGPSLNMLIKFTQAFGNSFQVHIKANETHPTWKPKPESWYYFEPGLITLGAKPNVDWTTYEAAVTAVDEGMQRISQLVKAQDLTYEAAKLEIDSLLKQYDPWQFVNKMAVAKDQLIDLSGGGLHHSWEEDMNTIPRGNILLELQAESMDDVSTFRNFDKGKIAPDGSIRQLHIEAYFAQIDRSAEANDPKTHIKTPQPITKTEVYNLEGLLRTPLYNMDKLTFLGDSGSFVEKLTQYKHLFVKNGSVKVTAGGYTIEVTTGHSCFVPFGAEHYTVTNTDAGTELLISY